MLLCSSFLYLYIDLYIGKIYNKLKIGKKVICSCSARQQSYFCMDLGGIFYECIFVTGKARG